MAHSRLRGLFRCLSLSPLLAAVTACGGDPAVTTDGDTDSSGSTDTQATTTTTVTAGSTGSETGTTTTDDPTTTNNPTTTTVSTSTSTSTTDETTSTTDGVTSTDSTSTSTSTSTTGEDTDTTDTGGGVIDGGLNGRPDQPVVLVGGQVPGLAGLAPGEIVGFKSVDGTWVPIPVQVDERVIVDFCTIYAAELLGANAPCDTAQTINALFYADPDTYTGPDTDPGFDHDDELVFMARDGGDRMPAGAAPEGVVAGSGVEVELSADGDKAWVYLFEREMGGPLQPGAGEDLVSYDVVFAGGIDYKTEYPFIGDGSCGNMTCDPPIVEDSTVKTDNYERHFSARWVTDLLRITTPESSGQDILDIAQARFAPGNCGRHVLTFSTAEGAFVANIDGPVRAIRSYLGANSGPLTQRTHLFYDSVEVVQTFLRVHAIPGIMELVDYSPDATGMFYSNEHNQTEVEIDGAPDPGFDTTAFSWELVSGPHGSVVSVIEPHLSQPLTTVAYYEDNLATPNNQCSASNLLDHPDDVAFGTSGTWITSAIPDTDPRTGGLDHVYLQRTSLYTTHSLAPVEAVVEADKLKAPPLVVARAWADQLGPACGDAACDPGEDASCPYDCAPYDQTCGDGLCDLWENSVSCAGDCGGMMGGPSCGDDTCDDGEHELSCAPDCWTPTFEPLVMCLDQACPAQKGACSDEQPCVDRSVCTAECVGGGGAINTCAAQCAMQIPATPEQAAFANALMVCAQQNCL